MASTNPNQSRGDIEVALEALGEKFVSGPISMQDGSQMVLAATGLSVHRLPALNPVLPGFVAQAETVVEPDSFVDYIRQFKSSTAICRASLSKNEIAAVLDYHGRAREGDKDAATPGRNVHVVTLKCPFDVDYAKWRGVFGKGLDQKGFAEFIEDMIHTIASPPAADLLEAISDLKIERSVRFKSARNDRNGNVQFIYEEVEGERPHDGSVTLPDHVLIVVPIFQGGPTVQLTAKLRYRMDKGDLSFSLAVPGIDNEERIAFRSIGERVRTDTATPVFYVA